MRFKLVEAETEQDNNKANEKRFFQLHKEKPFELIDGIFTIYMEYKNGEKKKQDDYITEIVKAFSEVQAQYPQFSTLLKINDGKTLLERQLKRYTARNTFDYFIHKDLGKFLRRELDFYIKNDVIFLDDIDEQVEAKIKEYLTKAKVIRKIAHKIIAFLAQIEDFQKKLFLKKKFVVETNYCITLDRIPEEFYPEIAANDAQREEWVRLFAIDEIEGDLTQPAYSVPLTVEFLKANPYLVLDTAFFSVEFKEKLIAGIDNLDKKLDGLLIHSENFQALNLLQAKYREKIKCVYIDPPYNTSEETFVYKNNYKHSSWISCLYDRVNITKNLVLEDGALLVTIDDEELYNLKMLLDNSWGKNQYIGTIVLQSNPRGRGINSYYATSHEYCLNYAKNPLQLEIINQPLTPEQEEQFKYSDDDSAYRLLPFRRSGGLSTPDERPNSEFPLYYNKKQNKIVAVGGERKYPYPSEYEPKSVLILDEKNNLEEIEIENFSHDNIEIIMPTDTNGNRRVWRWSDRFKILQAAKKGDFIINNDNGKYSVMLKDKIKYGRKPKTMWYDSKYDASSHGTNILQKLFGERKTFGYPKSIHSTSDSIYCIVGKDTEALILDFFAGSGTTAHAVINLNREDGGSRKYILVEMGEYFDTVTKPRIEKVIYSEDWKDGKPVSRKGSSHAFKYLRLESYEDTLNNIVLKGGQYDMLGSAREGYILSYMLDAEAEGSACLLNIDKLDKPFDYKMNITRHLESREHSIDLVETFNYLIGLTVTRSHALATFDAEFITGEYGAVSAALKDGNTYKFKSVEGILPSGDKALIIWREMTGDTVKDNAVLDAYFRHTFADTRGYEKIFVNCDNNLQNLRTANENWRVILIDEEMKKRLFEYSE